MAEETQTLTMDESNPESGQFTEEEMDSLKVGEEMAEAEDNRLAGKYENAQELEKAYIELEKKLGDKSEESSEPEAEAEEPAESEPEAKEEEPATEQDDESSTADEQEPEASEDAAKEEDSSEEAKPEENQEEKKVKRYFKTKSFSDKICETFSRNYSHSCRHFLNHN